MRTGLLVTAIALCVACSSERANSPQPTPVLSAARAACKQSSEPCADPLFVVDGRIISPDSVNLKGSDIESVEVIKGEVARSLYGEAARHGVVIIRTRQGR